MDLFSAQWDAPEVNALYMKWRMADAKRAVGGNDNSTRSTKVSADPFTQQLTGLQPQLSTTLHGVPVPPLRAPEAESMLPSAVDLMPPESLPQQFW